MLTEADGEQRISTIVVSQVKLWINPKQHYKQQSKLPCLNPLTKKLNLLQSHRPKQFAHYFPEIKVKPSPQPLQQEAQSYHLCNNNNSQYK